jgi:nitrogen fixation/metabolism regulation signal transduction histidine kinase
MVPPKAARFFNRRTISRDLTLSLALMTALVLSVFGVSYQIYYTNQEVVDLQAEAAAVADEFAGVLARPIWNMDVDTVTQIARAYLSSDFLTGVRVYTSLDVYFDNIPDHPRADRWIVSEREIVHAGEIIGSVALLFSKARIETIRTRSFVLTLVTIVLVTTVIGFGTHQLMKRLVADPLNRLITGIRTIAAGDYQLSLPPEKRSDINTLILEINIMAREIDRRESDLNKLRETLKISSTPCPRYWSGWILKAG